MIDSAKRERFQRLALPHLDSAFNLACWLTKNRSDAEDVVQEAYLRAFKFFDSLRGDDAHAWILKIVRNTFYNWHREAAEQRQHMVFEEDLHSSADDSIAASSAPEDALSQKESDRLLRQALASLPLEFREVMVLRELEDLSYKQIAEVAGIPIGTVMSRIARGRKLLMKTLATTVPEA